MTPLEAFENILSRIPENIDSKVLDEEIKIVMKALEA